MGDAQCSLQQVRLQCKHYTRSEREFVYGPKVRRGQMTLSGLDLAFTKYFAGTCEQDPWSIKY